MKLCGKQSVSSVKFTESELQEREMLQDLIRKLCGKTKLRDRKGKHVGRRRRRDMTNSFIYSVVYVL